MGCTNKTKKKEVVRDTSIVAKNSVNNLFLDSIQLIDFSKKNTSFNSFAQQFEDFYTARNYQYAWFNENGITQQANSFISLLQSTVGDLQDSSYFNKSFLQLQDSLFSKTSKLTNEETLQAELTLTGQFFVFAAKMYKGSDINAAELGWFIPRKKIDLQKILASTLQSDSTSTTQFIASNSQYKKMQSAIAFYHQLAKSNSWSLISLPTKSFKLNDTGSAFISIKEKLKLLGDASSNNGTAVFDSTLLIAIKSFQLRMGLTADGVIGKKCIEELNISPAKRIQQILINLERVRWMPNIKTGNYIVVNIPEYKMHVYESGVQQFDMDVIVGTATHSTVVFSGNLQYIVFSPYWNVPPSITTNEIMPAMKRNSNYLRNKNMEITGYENGIPTIRQKPGISNSLGLVKFLFPNSHNIYLHDTPNKDLFQESSRGFSHGCIRIAQPKKFAQYLLRSDTAKIWKSHVIDSTMHLTKEKWVTLNKSIPVLITYFTVWVDAGNKIHFRKDIYQHDEKLAAKLFVQ